MLALSNDESESWVYVAMDLAKCRAAVQNLQERERDPNESGSIT